MKELFHEPDKHRVEWPNTGLKESKARKLEGRARQPDFIVSVIHQLERSGALFIGVLQKKEIYIKTATI